MMRQSKLVVIVELVCRQRKRERRGKEGEIQNVEVEHK